MKNNAVCYPEEIQEPVAKYYQGDHRGRLQKNVGSAHARKGPEASAAILRRKPKFQIRIVFLQLLDLKVSSLLRIITG